LVAARPLEAAVEDLVDDSALYTVICVESFKSFLAEHRKVQVVYPLRLVGGVFMESHAGMVTL